MDHANHTTIQGLHRFGSSDNISHILDFCSHHNLRVEELTANLLSALCGDDKKLEERLRSALKELLLNCAATSRLGFKLNVLEESHDLEMLSLSHPTWACRKLFRTSGGCIGLGPEVMQVSDIVVKPSDMEDTVTLRRHNRHHSFIGCSRVPELDRVHVRWGKSETFELSWNDGGKVNTPDVLVDVQAHIACF